MKTLNLNCFKNIFFLFALLIFSCFSYGMGKDDPLIVATKIKQLDVVAIDNESSLAWDVEISAAKDFDKFYMIIEGDREKNEDKQNVTESELRFQYAHAVTPFWNVVVGARKDYAFSDSDADSEPAWLELGFRGLAPYYIETDASVFLGESGKSEFRFEAEKEFMLSQRWILLSDVEINVYGYNDKLAVIGSGLGGSELGLRVAYRIRREIKPYFGIRYERSYGDTRRFKDELNQEKSETKVVIGVNAWF